MLFAQQSYAMAYALVLAFFFLALVGVCFPRFRRVELERKKKMPKKK